MIFRAQTLVFLVFAATVAISLAEDDKMWTLPWWPTKKTTTTTAVTTSTTPTTTPTTPTTTPTTPTPTTPSTTPTTPTTIPTTPTTTPTTPTTTPTTPTTTPTTPTTTPTTPATTPTPTTTPTPPTTPIPPSPKDWVVQSDNGTVCIVANMMVKVTVPYQAKDNKTVNAPFEIKNVTDVKVSGNCGEKEQTLVLLTKDNVLFTFKFTENKTEYALSMIQLNIPINNKTFPNNTMVNVTELVLKHEAQVFTLPLDNSYTCTKVNPLSLNGTLNGTISVSDVKVQAFGTSNSTSYKTAMDCESNETPDIVPIAVGLILAGLVVVVLIAYLVGRRRAQARGYLSM